MKKILYHVIIFLFIFSPISKAQSQNLASQRQVALFTDNLDRNNTNSIYNPSNPENYDGTPYYTRQFYIRKCLSRK